MKFEYESPFHSMRALTLDNKRMVRSGSEHRSDIHQCEGQFMSFLLMLG